MIEGVKCPICGSDNVWFKLICTSLISGDYFDRNKYQCVECKNIFPVKQKFNKEEKEMNITIDQIIETFKDENKRKQIEEIISGDNAKEIHKEIFGE